jgi:hypothetical protein
MRRCSLLALATAAVLGSWTTADAAAVLQIQSGTGTNFTVTGGNDFPFLSEPFDLLVDAVLETTGPGVLTFEYLGFEAGYTNSFLFDGDPCFRTGSTAEGATCGGATAGGAIDFEFWSDRDTANLDAIVWDNLAPPGSILSYSIGVIQEGPNQFLLLWDDSGKKEDDNHDDLGVRVTFRPLEQVPEPASLTLMLAGMAGLAGLRRRRRL